MNNFKSIGEDVFIHETVIIKHPNLCRIGNHVAIDNGVTISTVIELDNYIHIAPYVCTIGGKNTKVTMKNFSFIAAGTKIVTGSEDYTGKGLVGPTIPIEYRELILGDILFDKYAGCGVNCSVMPGVKFNEGSILGANSIATSDLEPWTIYVGSPAKPIKKRNKQIIIEYVKKLGYEF